MINPTEDQIRQRAHELWDVAGRPEGREQEFWLEAERELKNSDVANNSDEKSSMFVE